MRYERAALPLAIGVVVTVLTVVSQVAAANPCTGAKRLQLRWSSKSHTALVSLSAVRCERPPACAASTTSPPGTLLTTSPITVTITDTAGHTLAGVVDPRAAGCGTRCGQRNNGGCTGGSDTHRLSGGFVRYVFNNQGQTTVVASRLKMPASESPTLTPPITVTFKDAAGYVVTAELRQCRVRQSATGTVIGCS